MALTVKQDNTASLLKGVKALIKNEVLVGIPDSTADRKRDEDHKEPASNALIGYVLETGSPANNIPARPFLLPGVEGASDAIADQMKKGARAALEGKLGDIDKAQVATGLLAQSSVKAKITSNIPPPLSQRTLDERKRRGVTSENTLRVTGQLLNAITFVVRPKGN